MGDGRRGLAGEAPGDARPMEVVQEGIDIGADVGAEIDVLGMLVHIEREDRYTARQTVGVVGRPDVAEPTVTPVFA